MFWMSKKEIIERFDFWRKIVMQQEARVDKISEKYQKLESIALNTLSATTKLDKELHDFYENTNKNIHIMSEVQDIFEAIINDVSNRLELLRKDMSEVQDTFEAIINNVSNRLEVLRKELIDRKEI